MVDVTVRGAGIFGLSVAFVCAQRGARVHVIDPAGPGAGSSGGVVGALAPHVPENWNAKKAFQLDSLLMAKVFWERVKDAGGVDAGYIRSGRIQPIADDAGLSLARRRSETATELWADHASWRVIPHTRQDWMPQSPSGWVVHDTLSAHIHPAQSIHSLVAALSAMGVRISADGPDRGQVLWATGIAGLEALNQNHHRQVGNGVKGQAAVLALDVAGLPQLFADTIHFIPHLNGTIAVGSTSERDYADPLTVDDQLDDVIARARKAVPVLNDAPVIQRWAGVRPRSRSRAPMLGAWPDRPKHFIANGGFKIGFGMAPKIGEVMADLMLENRNVIPEGFEVAASF